eukprot:3917934-Pyramimonas_sp.AAC.1
MREQRRAWRKTVVPRDAGLPTAMTAWRAHASPAEAAPWGCPRWRTSCRGSDGPLGRWSGFCLGTRPAGDSMTAASNA